MRAGIGLAGSCAVMLALSGGARAAVISTAASQALTTAPFAISFGGSVATYSFTAADTIYGPGAAVATGGTAQVSSLFGGVTDFFGGSAIDQSGQLYGFSAFPSASVIPFSAADDFIGLSFTLTDGVHYGYAEVAGPLLVGYGYETVPGASIATGAVSAVPEPASVALLGLGVMALATVGRRRQEPR